MFVNLKLIPFLMVAWCFVVENQRKYTNPTIPHKMFEFNPILDILTMF